MLVISGANILAQVFVLGLSLVSLLNESNLMPPSVAVIIAILGLTAVFAAITANVAVLAIISLHDKTYSAQPEKNEDG